jgi:hypothetical protein
MPSCRGTHRTCRNLLRAGTPLGGRRCGARVERWRGGGGRKKIRPFIVLNEFISPPPDQQRVQRGSIINKNEKKNPAPLTSCGERHLNCVRSVGPFFTRGTPTDKSWRAANMRLSRSRTTRCRTAVQTCKRTYERRAPSISFRSRTRSRRRGW